VHIRVLVLCVIEQVSLLYFTVHTIIFIVKLLVLSHKSILAVIKFRIAFSIHRQDFFSEQGLPWN